MVVAKAAAASYFSRPFIKLDGNKKNQPKCDQPYKSPECIQEFFDHSQHYNGKQEEGSYFIPDPQLVGGPPEDPFLLVAENLVKTDMVTEKPQTKTSLTNSQEGRLP